MTSLDKLYRECLEREAAAWHKFHEMQRPFLEEQARVSMELFRVRSEMWSRIL